MITQSAGEPPKRVNSNSTPSSIERLEQISIPALILVGEEDLEAIHAQGVLLERRLGDAQVVSVPAGGHLLNMTSPYAFRESVSAFLGFPEIGERLTTLRGRCRRSVPCRARRRSPHRARPAFRWWWRWSRSTPPLVRCCVSITAAAQLILLPGSSAGPDRGNCYFRTSNCACSPLCESPPTQRWNEPGSATRSRAPL